MLDCTGTGNLRLDTPNFWPNPGNGFVSLDLTSLTGKVNLRLCTVLNIQVYKEDNVEANLIKRLDFSSLPEGLYFLGIEQNGKWLTGKLIIRK